jgi:hypothetical protein
MSLNGKIVLAASIFAGVSLGIVFFAAMPLISEIDEVWIQIAAQKDDAVKLDGRILRVRQYREFAKKEAENLAEMDSLLADSQMPDFINYLEGAADEAGVEMVLSPSISRSESDDDWPAMNYQADIAGNVDGVLKFVKNIEVCPYLVKVDGFSIRAGAEQSGSTKGKELNYEWADPGTARISLKVYVKK